MRDKLTTSDSNNIDIGSGVEGMAGESNTIRIGNHDITDTIIGGSVGDNPQWRRRARRLKRSPRHRYFLTALQGRDQADGQSQ